MTFERENTATISGHTGTGLGLAVTKRYIDAMGGEIRKLQDTQLANTPIIAVSANAFDEDKEASAKAGMNAHIEKPIQLDYPFSTLESLLKE